LLVRSEAKSRFLRRGFVPKRVDQSGIDLSVV
jgi:hypothetical protein